MKPSGSRFHLLHSPEGASGQSEVLLDLNEQIKAVARRPLAQLQLRCYLWPLLEQRALSTVTHAIIFWHLDYYNHEGYLEDYLEVTVDAKGSCPHTNRGNLLLLTNTNIVKAIPVVSLSLGQFSLVVITCKVLRGSGSDCIQNCWLQVKAPSASRPRGHAAAHPPH